MYGEKKERAGWLDGMESVSPEKTGRDRLPPGVYTYENLKIVAFRESWVTLATTVGAKALSLPQHDPLDEAAQAEHAIGPPSDPGRPAVGAPQHNSPSPVRGIIPWEASSNSSLTLAACSCDAERPWRKGQHEPSGGPDRGEDSGTSRKVARARVGGGQR